MLPIFDNINDAVNTTFMVILIVSVILLVGITGTMVYFAIRYNRKRHPVPAPVESHTVLEVVWTVIPMFLVIGMFYYGYVGFKMMRHPPPNPYEVKAIAQMWSWSFVYDNGKTSPELYVPQGRAIKVSLESRDVLHSFYLPAYMVKQDVVPGLKNDFLWFDAKEVGTSNIFCAEYCGQRHSFMLSKVHVIPADEFEEWVKEGAAPPKPTEDMSEEEREEQLVRYGEQLSHSKGCVACHTIDGTTLVGPTYQNLFGRTEHVVTDGKVREIVIDEAYVRKSILDPAADIVEGFQPLMPSQQGLVSDEELDAIVAYLKTL